MKKLFLMLLPLLFAICAEGQTVNKDFEKLKWLNGSWKRTNNKPGQNGYENWIIAAPGKLTGKGITLRGADTAVVEKLSIVIRDNAIYYVADVTGNPKPVYFKMTSITADSFVCENPEHDFPKKIAYTLIGGHVKATISAGARSVDYLFDKVK